MAFSHRSLLSKVLAGIALGSASGMLATGGCADRELDELQRPPAECEAEMCMADDLREDESVRQVCLAMEGSTCSACDDLETLEAAENQLAGQCGFIEARRIECGPTVTDNNLCCYSVAVVEDYTDCNTTIGRPFIVQGRERTATVDDGKAWIRSLQPSLEGLFEDDRRTLAQAWTRDALAEHASIAAFARHVLELMSLGAPPELVAAVQRAANDEIEHARLCFGLAHAYGGAQVGPGPMSLHGLGLEDRDRAAIAVALVVEGCIGETLAAAEAQVARDTCQDPAVTAVLDRIARDESRHAALAWRTLAWLLGDGDPQIRRVVREAFDRALRAGPSDGAGEDDARHAHHGRLGPNDRRAVALETLAGVIAPAAEQLLGGPTPRADRPLMS